MSATLDLALNPWQTYAACGRYEPNLWDTPAKRAGQMGIAIPRARRAIAICKTCPVRAECGADAREDRPRGVIRAGIAYDDSGFAMPKCCICYESVLTGDPRSRYCEKHDRYDLVRLGRKAAA